MLGRRNKLYAQRHTVFDAPTEKKHQSEYIWASRSAKILLLVGIFGIAASSFAATPDSLDVNAFDPKKPAIAQAKGFNKKLKDKAPKYKRAHPNKASQDQDKSAEKAQIIHDVKARKAAIKAAIISNPTAVADAALPQDVKDSLPEEAKADVEATTELTGVWQTGHFDTIAKEKTARPKPSPFAIVTTSDGHDTFAYGQLPSLGNGREVKVTGIVVDHVIATSTAGVKVKASKADKSTSGKDLINLASSNNGKTKIKLADTRIPDVWVSCDGGDAFSKECTPAPQTSTNNLDDNPIPPVTARSVLVVPVRFSDTGATTVNPITGQPYSPVDLQNVVAGNPNSSAAFFKSNSGGKLNLTAFAVNWVTLPGTRSSTCSAQTDGTSLDGVVSSIHEKIKDGTIPFKNYSDIVYMIDADTCINGSSAAFAIPQANKELGTGLESFYFLKSYGMRNIAGAGYDVYPDGVSFVVDHELGHSFGLSHARTTFPSGPSVDVTEEANNDEYGNLYDIMGTTFFYKSGLHANDPETPLTDASHLSAFQKWELGWLTTGAGVQDVTTKGVYSLSPLEGTAGVRGLRVPIARNSAGKVTQALFFEYRKRGVDPVFDNFPTLWPDHIDPGVLVNLVTAGKETKYGQLANPASQIMLLHTQSSGYDNGDPTGLAPEVTYRYKVWGGDGRNDVCVKQKNIASDATASVEIVPGCGASIGKEFVQYSGQVATFGLLNTSHAADPITSTSPSYSSAVCFDPVAHQAYVADNYRVLAYDLDPVTNKPLNSQPDHVLGADRIYGGYSYTDSPAPGIDPTTFSVQWFGKLIAPGTGQYAIQTVSDDGVRVTVGTAKPINNWTDHSVATNTGYVNLVAGQQYDIKVDFYNNQGPATLQLKWAGPGLGGYQVIPASAFVSPGLRANYYNNQGKDSAGKVIDFTGTAVSRIDPNIDNPWGRDITQRAPTFAETDYGNGLKTPSQKSISYNSLRLACDPTHHRLFVAQTGSSSAGITSRVSVFDLTNGITNGMNASYVLGQPDFTSANVVTGGYTNNYGNYYQANTFTAADIAYSTDQNTLFVAQAYAIPRVLAFEFGPNNDKLANNMSAAYAIGRPDGDFTKAPLSSAENSFGSPYSIAIDDAHDRLFWASGSQALAYGNGGNFITTFPLPTAASEGVKAHWRTYSSMIKIDKTVNSIPPPIPGAMVVSADGNTLYEMPTGASASITSTSSIGRPMNVYNVTNLPIGLNVGAIVTPVITPSFAGYTLADQIALDSQNNLMYMPNRHSGVVNIYPMGVLYKEVVKPPSPDPYSPSITMQ